MIQSAPTLKKKGKKMIKPSFFSTDVGKVVTTLGGFALFLIMLVGFLKLLGM